MNAFHVIGGLTAVWALIVTFIGITRENFPATKRAERLTMTISLVLVLGSIGAAIATAEKHEHGGEHEESALVR